MTSRLKSTAKTDKNHQISLEERLDHLITTVESQQNILDRFMSLYKSEKLQTLSQGEDGEKQKKDAIVVKDTEIVKMRQEIFNMKLAMERQTAIYVREKTTWDQECDQLQKELALNLKPAPIPASALDQKQDKVLTLSDEDAKIEKAARILCMLQMGFEPNLGPTAEMKKTAEQQLKQDVVSSPKNESEIEEAGKGQAGSVSTNEDAKPSSTPTPAAAEPLTTDPIDDNARRNLRQRFVAQLLRHPCTDSTCLILAFRGYVVHASQCHDGPECSWYICRRVQAKTEHLKTCKDKLDCTFCQPYIYFNDYKMQGMMRVLEKGCPLNRNGVHGASESTRESIMLMVARLAVYYGLVGDNEKPDEDNEDEIPEAVDVMTMSSCSEFSSSSSESSAGEEKTSGGENTSEEWEIIEAEQRYEVD